MKKTLQCPKCEGRQLAHIARVKTWSIVGTGGLKRDVPPMPLVIRKTRGFRSGFVPFELIGGYESFICRGCGYSELYAIDHDKLDPAIDPDVHFIDNEPKATLR